MILLLFAASFVLFVWGLIVLFTGGYVATLDIAANLVSSAALVLGLAVLARLGERALERFSGQAVEGTRARPGFFNRVSVRAASERETPAAAPAATPAPALAPAAASTAASAAAPGSAASGSDPAQTVIREGVVEGRHFRLYADGSIDAEGPTGMRRYRSVDELRADMLAAAGDDTPSASEQREAAPEEAREPTARSPFAPRPADEPHPQSEPRSDSRPDSWAEPRERPGFGGHREASAETGLGGVRPSERLSPSRETPSRSSWSDRFRSTSLFDKDEASGGGGESGSGENSSGRGENAGEDAGESVEKPRR